MTVMMMLASFASHRCCCLLLLLHVVVLVLATLVKHGSVEFGMVLSLPRLTSSVGAAYRLLLF